MFTKISKFLYKMYQDILLFFIILMKIYGFTYVNDSRKAQLVSSHTGARARECKILWYFY